MFIFLKWRLVSSIILLNITHIAVSMMETCVAFVKLFLYVSGLETKDKGMFCENTAPDPHSFKENILVTTGLNPFLRSENYCSPSYFC